MTITNSSSFPRSEENRQYFRSNDSPFGRPLLPPLPRRGRSWLWPWGTARWPWPPRTAASSAGTQTGTADLRVSEEKEWGGGSSEGRNEGKKEGECGAALADSERKIQQSNGSTINPLALLRLLTFFATVTCILHTAVFGPEIDISKKPEDTIHKIFLDPTGNHLLVCLHGGETYYLHSGTPRPKRLLKWTGVVVEAVAFDSKRCTEVRSSRQTAISKRSCHARPYLSCSG